MKLDKLESIFLILTLLSARDRCHDVQLLVMYNFLQYFPPSPSQLKIRYRNITETNEQRKRPDLNMTET